MVGLCTMSLYAEDNSESQTPGSACSLPRYQKREVMITMRDGVRLYTSILEPVDSVPCPQGHPILLTRTCYSCRPYGTEGEEVSWQLNHPGDSVYMAAGYIFVHQDVRGKCMSEGDFVEIRPFVEGKKTPRFRRDGTVVVNRKAPVDEASDTYETCEWLIHNTNSNRRIGVYGISYPGFYSTMAALSGHPALCAVSPQAPVTDWWRGDDVHHNGAFALADMFSFQPWFEYGCTRPAMLDPDYLEGLRLCHQEGELYDSYLRLGAISNMSALMGDSVHGWLDVINHPDLDDFWEASNVTRGHCHDVKPAVMIVGGLFDAEDCYGALQTYRAIRAQSPATHLSLIEGPWSHGGWTRGAAPFFDHVYFGPEQTAEWYMANVEYPFFAYYLEGKGEEPGTGVSLFDTGSLRWRHFDNLPIADSIPTQAFSLLPEGKASVSYVSDPAHPVPFMDQMLRHRPTEYMLADQRFAARRPDVYSILGEVLTDSLTLCGPVTCDLQVSLTTTDADLVVKLIDVFPDDFAYPDSLYDDGDARAARYRRWTGYPMEGYQMLVRFEIMRGRYRDGGDAPKPFVPGEVTPVHFMLNDVHHTFLPGHRLMVQVQSTMFPLFDRNPQQYVDIYHCSDADFVPTKVTLHSGSRLLLPLLK